MANTPLELYDCAYRLQYHEKKIQEAIKLYETIIREFPESNECGYAVIQLQKIKANDITGALKKSSSGAGPLLAVSFIVSCFAFLVAVIGILLLAQQLRMEHYRVTLAVAALGKMSYGKDESALKILDELKKISPRDVLPIELASDIDRRHEFGRTTAISPPPVSSPPRASDNVGPRDQTSTAAVAEAATVPVVKKLRPPERTKAPVAPKQAPTKKTKGLFIVDPDSLSFF